MRSSVSRLVVVSLAVVLLGSSLAIPAGASPDLESGVVFRSKANKAQAKADAKAEKAAAEATKARRKCDATGVLPCARQATLSWSLVGDGYCVAVVTVAGFAPGAYGWTLHVPPGGGLTMNQPVQVGADGTGQQFGHVAVEHGEVWFARVDGAVDSALSTAVC